MLSRDPIRPGPTPIIRLDGDSIIYRLWVTHRSRPCDMLVLRCDGQGNVTAAIDHGVQVCNDHSAP